MLLWILPILHLSLSWRGPWPFNSSLLGRARACFAQENRMKWYVGAVSCLQVLVTTLHMAHNFDSLHNCRLPLPTQQHSDTLTLSSLCRGVLDSVCVSTAGRSKHRQTWSDLQWVHRLTPLGATSYQFDIPLWLCLPLPPPTYAMLTKHQVSTHSSLIHQQDEAFITKQK